MKALAESGDVEAQFYVACMYEDGQGVPKNHDDGGVEETAQSDCVGS